MRKTKYRIQFKDPYYYVQRRYKFWIFTWYMDIDYFSELEWAEDLLSHLTPF